MFIRIHAAAAACVLRAAALGIGALCACTSTAPVSTEARVAGRPAQHVVVALDAPCSLSPGGTPMGRPDGEHGHTLQAGRYVPRFEDERGVFFASPNGVIVTEPAPLGTRALAGGIYLPSEVNAGAWEYLGDAARVSQRYRLPEHCRYSIENAAPAAG
jgi:hypothetical protein